MTNAERIIKSLRERAHALIDTDPRRANNMLDEANGQVRKIAERGELTFQGEKVYHFTPVNERKTELPEY
jgi:hypothetical protein